MLEHILFVDDDSNLISSYMRQFRKFFTVFSASNAEDGLQIIEDHSEFAVIITDFHMPGMNGLDFLKKIQEKCSYTVFIVVTGGADLSIAIRAVNEGFIFRFLTKPISGDDLLAIIKSAVKQYKINKMIAAALPNKEDIHVHLPICSHCKKIRSKEGNPFLKESWEHMEIYFSRKFGIDFSHGLCPDCVEELYDIKTTHKHD